MRNAVHLNAASACLVAFANKPVAVPKPETAKIDETAEKPAASMQIFAPRSDIQMPAVTRKTRGGSQSPFKFDELTAVGMSFGIAGRNAKSVSAVVSAQNRKSAPIKTNPDGSPIYKTKPVTDANGVIVGAVPQTDKKGKPIPERGERTREYKAFDVDAKTDPDGASVRIFRLK